MAAGSFEYITTHFPHICCQWSALSIDFTWFEFVRNLKICRQIDCEQIPYAKFLRSIIFAFFMDGFSTTKSMLREIVAFLLYFQTSQTLKGVLRGNITLPAISSHNIGINCILQSKRQQPVHRSKLSQMVPSTQYQKNQLQRAQSRLM